MKCPVCNTEINPAAEMGKLRASKLTPERRKEIAQKAIEERWRRHRTSKTNKIEPG